MKLHLLSVFVLVAHVATAQKEFEKTARFGISIDNKRYYDSGQYKLANMGAASSQALSLSYQWLFNAHMSWNFDLQMMQFRPEYTGKQVAKGAAFQTTIKGYLFPINDCYACKNKCFNPFLTYGFQQNNVYLTNQKTKFTQINLSAGIEMFEKSGFSIFGQTGYNLSLNDANFNALSAQLGLTYRFDTKKRAALYEENQTQKLNLEACNTNLQNHVKAGFLDSLSKAQIFQKQQNEINDLRKLSDSLELAHEQINNKLASYTKYVGVLSDSLKITKEALHDIYIKQWQKLEWVEHDSSLKTKSGYFALVSQSFDYNSLITLKNSVLPLEKYVILKNKHDVYRLLYYLGNRIDANFDVKFAQIIEVFPEADILKLEDF